MKIPKHIVIATGIYPPDVGGPAQYAKELFETFLTQKYSVSVVSFGSLTRVVTGVRHIVYFFKLCASAFGADYIIALDTFTVALPALVLSMITGARVVVRVGGDFLWESYVERTGERILLSEFYAESRNFTFKERLIYRITRFILRSASHVVFSTDWQRKSMIHAYGLIDTRTSVIENFYPPTNISEENVNRSSSENLLFLSPSRDRVIKNKKTLYDAWNRVVMKYPHIELDTRTVSHEFLQEKISKARAIIVPSFSEVSPNIVLDGLAKNIPSIVTHDIGIKERLSGMVAYIDPFSVDDVVRAIETLCDDIVYAKYVHAIETREWSHSWNEIAQEFIDIFQRI